MTTFPDRRFPFDPRLDSLLRGIPEAYECPHCHTTVRKGGSLHVVNAGTGGERRYCSAKCRFEGRPVFQIRICKRYYITQCAAANAEQARGLIGYHDSDRCPDCKVWQEGFEFWGENGHLQGCMTGNDHPTMDYLKSYALRHGSRLRIEFIEGGTLRYLRP